MRIDARLIGRLHREARADRWDVPLDRFGRALEASAAKAFSGRDPSTRELERYLRSLRLEDLALASACADGHSAAWEYFVVEYRSTLYRAADAIDRSGGARELADALYAELFGLPDAGKERRSLFTYFHGRSSLATWLRAILAQRCVDRARAAVRTEPLADLEPPVRPPGEPDPDRPRLLALIHSAFRQALNRLDARNRLRLRYYYSQELTLAETGRLLGEHEASVSRHLAAARKAIRRDVENQLLEARLDSNQISRCFECIAEDAGPLDLEALLASDARNFDLAVQRDDPSGRPAPAVLVEKRAGKTK